MASLEGTVAVVTGASRGLGKGIALGLGEAGATVYVTGRSTAQRAGELPGTIDETAEAVSRLGGRGVAVACDHRNDDEVEALFKRVRADEGRLDVLVNCAMASPAQSVLWGGQLFWEMPISLWDDLIDVGLRSHFVASRFAAPLLIEQSHGTIINVASHGSVNGKRESMSDALISYSVGKAGLHRLTSDMAVELRDTGVAVIAVWPPATRTEGVLADADVFGDLSRWREPIFTGRVVAAFVATREPLAFSGQALVITDLASELGVSP
jgi:NAD(P)-dependent dehydrogenase (short-subunit alcohol dehydrogenase family)